LFQWAENLLQFLPVLPLMLVFGVKCQVSSVLDVELGPQAFESSGPRGPDGDTGTPIITLSRPSAETVYCLLFTV
jgi:hypothetical protein